MAEPGTVGSFYANKFISTLPFRPPEIKIYEKL